jgi:predicted outer membrane repeat protein
MSVGYNIVLLDVEVRNGRVASVGGFLVVGSSGSTNLTNVIVRNIFADQVAGGAIYGQDASGWMKNVTFIDCVHQTEAGAIFIQDPRDFRFEDVSFINCTTISTPYSTTALLISTFSAPGASVVFAGELRFEKCGSLTTNSASAVFRTNHGSSIINITATTDPENPAKWFFENSADFGILLYALYPGFIYFEADSVSQSNVSLSPDVDPSIFYTLGNSPYTATILVNSIDVTDGCVLQSEWANTNLTVIGDITSRGSLCDSVINLYSSSTGSKIFARDLIIEDFHNSAIKALGSAQISLSRNLLVTSSSPITQSAIRIGAPDSSITSQASMNFSYCRLSSSSSNGGAIEVASNYADLELSALDDIFFLHNLAPASGGAVFADSNTRVSISGRNILFEGNEAVTGGAIAARKDSDFQIISTASLTFRYNSANVAGAAYIDSHNASFFATADYIGNYANNSACIFAFSDLNCPGTFLFGGSVAGNSLGLSSTSTGCAYFDAFCATTPVSINPLGCSGSPPTSNSYCSDGIWIVPATELATSVANTPKQVFTSPIEIVGDVSISSISIGNVLSRSASSSAFIHSKSCLVIGSIDVELSDEDVKSIEENPRTAVLSSSSCASTTTVITTSGSKPEKSCKKLGTEPVKEGGTLSATFRVSSSRCNVWWIVLASVLGGVILLLLLAVLVYKLSNRLRKRLQPYFHSNT